MTRPRLVSELRSAVDREPKRQRIPEGDVASLSDPPGSLRRMTSPAHSDQHLSASDPFIA